MVLRSVPLQSSPATFDVCGIGNAIVDIISDCDDTFLDSYGITKGAMTLIDEARADFLYAKMKPGVEMSGGSVANTVAGVAALGGTPTYIGKVKEDQLGTIFRHDMESSGIHFPTKPSTSGAATARCLIMVTPDAQRSMCPYLGACVDLSTDDVDPVQAANAQITFLEGYLYDKPKAKEAFYEAARIAHSANRRLALSLSDTFCVDRHRDGFRALVKEKVDILLSNEYELMSLYQVSSFEEAIKQARSECSLVVCTRSEQGAIIAQNAKTYIIQSEKPATVLDTTGAGDMFAAGLLFGLTHGFDVPTSGRIGAIAASEVISHYGPRPQTDLKAFVQARGVKV